MSEDRENVIRKLGGKCVKCGVTDTSILHIDHKLGQGYIEKEFFKNPKEMYEWYAKNFEYEGEYLQILCMNCNYSKRIANKEVKHRPKLSESVFAKQPPFDLKDREKSERLQKDMFDYLDEYPQFMPFFRRQLRMIVGLVEKRKQELIREGKFKEPDDWEREGYKE